MYNWSNDPEAFSAEYEELQKLMQELAREEAEREEAEREEAEREG